MPRQINDTQQFTDKLVKFIPTEIIGAYTVLASTLNFDMVEATPVPDSTQNQLIQVVFAVLLLLTPVYLWKISNVRHRMQLLISTISFAVWVYLLGGPFVVWNLYDATVAPVFVVLWALIPPLFVNAESVAA